MLLETGDQPQGARRARGIQGLKRLVQDQEPGVAAATNELSPLGQGQAGRQAVGIARALRELARRPRDRGGVDDQRLFLERRQRHRGGRIRRGGLLRAVPRGSRSRNGRVARTDVRGELVERRGRLVGDAGEQGSGDAGRPAVQLQRRGAAAGRGDPRRELRHLGGAGAQGGRLLALATCQLVQLVEPFAQRRRPRAERFLVPRRRRRHRPGGLWPVAKLFAQRAGQCVKVVQPTLPCRRQELRLRVTPARFIGARAAELHQELLRGLRAVPLQEFAQLALRPIVPLALRAQPLHRAVGLLPDRFDRR